ncbi:MAG: serine/threonine protein kinase, partial [Planctomycetales bacterium]
MSDGNSLPRESLDLSALERIDLVCVQVEDEWRAGKTPYWETELEGMQPAERNALLWELLLLEWEYRARRNEVCDLADFQQRFPGDRELVAEALKAFTREKAKSKKAKTDSSVSQELAPGASLGEFGGYELLEEIARGGMGVVYRARQVSLDREVAVKMVLSAGRAGVENQRFLNEAEAAAKLQHPNIVAVHEISEHEGEPFFSMAFVEGQSLRQLIDESPPSPRAAARYALKIAEAMQYAHEHGILHRDLKPSNVMIDQSLNARITDFGLSKRLESGDSLTATGQILGTPNDMSPEQTQGVPEEVGAASDVYQIGAVLYETLTGRPPFQGDSISDTLRQVRDSVIITPRHVNRKIPRDLEIICLKCLEKLPANRYGSAGELARELRCFLDDEPIQTRGGSGLRRVWRRARRQPLDVAAWVLLMLVTMVTPGLALH